MMEQPKEDKLQEEVFEWIIEDGKQIKITKDNANGRICAGCLCKCPCRCADCRPFCCSRKHKS